MCWQSAYREGKEKLVPEEEELSEYEELVDEMLEEDKKIRIDSPYHEKRFVK